MSAASFSPEELRDQMLLSKAADALLETCVRERLSLRATMDRFLPAVCGELDAVGAAVITRNEELVTAAYAHGELAGEDPWTLLAERRFGRFPVRGHTLVSQVLDVAGTDVGTAGFVFDGELPPERLEGLAARVEVVCEQLDTILATIHTASEKQDLIQRISQALADRVFERGLDTAVSLLHQTVGFQTLLFVWRDGADEKTLYYRLYRGGKLEFDAESRRHPGLDAAIQAHGVELLAPDRHRLRTVLGLEGCLENVLLAGLARAEWLGKCLVQAGPRGFSTFSLDLVRLLAQMARERLVDHNRERRHLAQFFAPPVINRLLREPAYDEKHLAPREQEVAILYADINGFTRLSELALEKPSLIGKFIDRWAEGAVDILWEHGGTFDKMVGDCIIGLFGPPFYEEPRARRAFNALEAARKMLDFTVRFADDPLLDVVRSKPELARGLGIAVGINLCPACVGVFGPTHDLTAFSAGMNATARLQCLAGFREVLAMESVVHALGDLGEPHGYRFGELTETPVKNVSKPLRYAAVIPADPSG